MQVVNRGQVHILFVPGEHALPSTHIHVTCGHPSQSLPRIQAEVKQPFLIIKVPRNTSVKQRSFNIGPINRRTVLEGLPEKSLHFNIKFTLSHTIVLLTTILKSLEILTVHQKVHEFEDTFSSTDVLFNRFLHGKTFRINHLSVCSGAGLPVSRRNYLKDSRIAD